MVRRPEGRQENLLLRAAREGRGLKIAETARALEEWAYANGHTSFTCSEDKYRTWEQGCIPHGYAWPVLTGYFGMTPEELGLRPYPAVAGRADVPSRTVDGATASFVLAQEDAVDRRQFAATLPILTMPAPTEPRQVGMDDVQRLRQAIVRLEAIGDEIGGETLHAVAGRYLAHAQRLLACSYQPKVGTALRMAAAELATDAGWFAFDAGQQAAAHSYFTHALYLARVADDTLLEAQVYSLMSLVANADRRSREALHLAHAGQRAAASGPPRLRALFDAREALATARLGDRTQSRTALGRAWRRMSADDDEAPPWIAFFNPAELRSIEATCDADLGAVQQAAEHLEQVVNERDAFERNRALRSARLAELRLGTGDLDGACAAGRLAIARPVGSARVRASLANVATKLASHHRTPCVASFLQEWRVCAAGPVHG